MVEKTIFQKLADIEISPANLIAVLTAASFICGFLYHAGALWAFDGHFLLLLEPYDIFRGAFISVPLLVVPFVFVVLIDPKRKALGSGKAKSKGWTLIIGLLFGVAFFLLFPPTEYFPTLIIWIGLLFYDYLRFIASRDISMEKFAFLKNLAFFVVICFLIFMLGFHQTKRSIFKAENSQQVCKVGACRAGTFIHILSRGIFFRERGSSVVEFLSFDEKIELKMKITDRMSLPYWNIFNLKPATLQ